MASTTFRSCLSGSFSRQNQYERQLFVEPTPLPQACWRCNISSAAEEVVLVRDDLVPRLSWARGYFWVCIVLCRRRYLSFHDPIVSAGGVEVSIATEAFVVGVHVVAIREEIETAAILVINFCAN